MAALAKRRGKELVPGVLPKRLQELSDALAVIKAKDEEIVMGMNRFADVPSVFEPEQRQKYVELLNTAPLALIRDVGFSTREELRLALLGSLPKSEAPVAMQSAHERTGMRIRKDGSGKSGTTVNLNMVTIPAPRPTGPEDRIIIVQPGEKK